MLSLLQWKQSWTDEWDEELLLSLPRLAKGDLDVDVGEVGEPDADEQDEDEDDVVNGLIKIDWGRIAGEGNVGGFLERRFSKTV